MFELLNYAYFVVFVAIVVVISLIIIISYFAHHQELADIRYQELQQQSFQNRYDIKKLESQKYLDLERMRLEAEMSANVQTDPMETLAMAMMQQKAKDNGVVPHVDAEIVNENQVKNKKLDSELMDLYQRYPTIYEKLMSGELMEILKMK